MSVQPTSIAAYNQADLLGHKLDVFNTIQSAGDDGITDPELSDRLKRHANCVAPARNHLVKMGLVTHKLIGGKKIRRQSTRSSADCYVWVVA